MRSLGNLNEAKQNSCCFVSQDLSHFRHIKNPYFHRLIDRIELTFIRVDRLSIWLKRVANKIMGCNHLLPRFVILFHDQLLKGYPVRYCCKWFTHRNLPSRLSFCIIFYLQAARAEEQLQAQLQTLREQFNVRRSNLHDHVSQLEGLREEVSNIDQLILYRFKYITEFKNQF